MYLLDTDVLIDIQRGHAPAISWFASLSELPSVPGFVVMEMIQDSQNKQQLSNALKLVAPLPVVWATEARLYKSGKLKQVNRKCGLSEKVAQIGEIDFCLSSGSITLMRKINSEKKGFVRDVEQHDLKTYQEYLDFRKRKINDYNLLDMLEL